MATMRMTERNLFEHFKSSFDRIVSCDSEYRSSAGNLCEPICFVYRDVITTETWHCKSRDDVLKLPFNLDKTLFVVFYATAEFESWIAWNVPLPWYVLDLWVENKNVYQTGNEPKGTFTMLSVARHHRIDGNLIISEEEKKYWRDKIINQNKYDKEEWWGILNYCEDDAILTAALVEPTLIAIQNKFLDIPVNHLLAQIVARGFSKGLEAWVYSNGIPVDEKSIKDFNKYFPEAKSQFLNDKNKTLKIYDDAGKFKHTLFAELIKEIGLDEVWDVTKTGKFSTSKVTLEKFKEIHPKIKLFREVKRIIESNRLAGFCIGVDGRSRGWQRFYSTITGRAAPSSTDNAFQAPRWVRSFIKSPVGYVLCYIDYSHQEPCIQAALSNDRALAEAVKKDVYMYTAEHTGATKGVNDPDRLKEIRKRYKIGFLALSYSMGYQSLAIQLNVRQSEAKEIHASIKRLYSHYYTWLYKHIQMFKIRGFMCTLQGWSRTCKNAYIKNYRSLDNWPIQSHGAQILYHALCCLYENGFIVCSTVHDAMLLQIKDDENLELNIKKAQQIMSDAAQDIIGSRINTDVEIIKSNKIYEQQGDAKDLYVEIMGRVEKIKRCHQNDDGCHQADASPNIVMLNNNTYRHLKKIKTADWIDGKFIRGPLALLEVELFGQHGARLLKLYLYIKYKEGIQTKGNGPKNKQWWPDREDSSWVRLGNNSQFFTYRQDKATAIKTALKYNLIEVKAKGSEEKKSPVVRIVKVKNV